MSATATDSTAAEAATQAESQLREHRRRIDAIDEELLALLNQRIEIARDIGAIKQSLHESAKRESAQRESAIYRPEREARVLRRLRELNRGQLDEAGLEALFREIISITRAAEGGLKVAILGPLGTYTEAAARRHFGSAIQLTPQSTIDDIFRACENGQTDFAVAPVENSTEGGVRATLDRLITTPLRICGEVHLRVQHQLLGANEKLSDIKRVIAHAQSLAQCRNWLRDNLPAAELIACHSNAEAAAQVQNEPTTAAIAGARAAARYGLVALATGIEDEPNNTTRFVVLSKRPAPSSGDDKTSLLLSCRNRPGALFHLLRPLLNHGVDMTRIESRPSKTGLWEYLFFVDITGHSEQPAVAAALAELKAEAGLYKNLGSYPVSRPVSRPISR